MKQYKNIKTSEIVLEEEAENYVLDKLGIQVIPKGKNGELTLEQVEFIDTYIEWYFSDNWIKEEIEDEIDEDIPNLEYELEKADRIYQDNLDKKWGVA